MWHVLPGRIVSLVARGIASCLTKRAIVLASAALTVSCGDATTAPRDGSTVPEPGFIVVSRTTDIAARDGRGAIHHTTRDTLQGEVRAARKTGLTLPAASLAPSSVQGSAPISFDVRSMPMPPRLLPARYETAMCKALPSYSRSTAETSTGATIKTAGTGDAPPATIELLQDGRLVATVERTWTRTALSWQLERQVTFTPDGSFRDVVTYQHRTAHGQIAVNAIPVANCVAPMSQNDSPASASRGYYAPQLLPPGGPSFTAACVSDDEYYGSDVCFDKRIGVYAADVALAVAGAAAAGACIYPVTVVAQACALAVVTWTAAVANLKLAQMSLDNCRAEAARRKCSCQNATARVPAGSPGFIPSLAADCVADGWYDEYSPAFGPSAGSGSTGDGAGSGQNCSWEVWEISYDGGNTWEYYGTFWVCYVNQI